MLSVNIICVGKLKEKYLTDAIKEYSTRLSAFCKFSIVELSEYSLPEKPSQAQIDKALSEEGKEIIKRLSKNSFAEFLSRVFS